MNLALIGNSNATRKLDPEDVRLIRKIHEDKQNQIKRLNESCSAAALAEKFGVHVRTVEKALRYETHRNVYSD